MIVSDVFQSKRTDEPNVFNNPCRVICVIFFLLIILFCFVFSVFPSQRCGVSSKEAQDARATVHASSTTYPQQFWVQRDAHQTNGHHVSEYVSIHKCA